MPRVQHLLVVAAAFGLLGCSSAGDDGGGNVCGKSDQDGVIGGDYTFDVHISDTAFTPLVLKTQNTSNVTLTVTNDGTKPHDFVVQCSNTNGCTSCFPDEAKVPPLAPGASKTVTFHAPLAEGIYGVVSDVAGDALTAQFIIQ